MNQNMRDYIASAAWLALALSLSTAAMAQPAGGSMASPAAGKGIEEKFTAANTTNDGHLTKAQADAGNLRGISRSFAEIDRGTKGYVTMDDIKVWMKARRNNNNGTTPGSTAAGAPTPAGSPPSDPQ